MFTLQEETQAVQSLNTLLIKITARLATETTHLFNGLFSMTTWASRHEKG